MNARTIADISASLAGACVFCGRADRPMTREHVFAHWLVRQVHGARLVPSGLSRDNAPASAAAVRISRVVARVCAACNAGWMSGLEVAFRRTLFARPRVGLLQTPERVTLSRWFAKTAVLLANAHGLELVGATRRAQLVAGMPDGIEVFVARQRRPRQRLDFALDVEDTGQEAHVRSVALLVDDLLAFVAERDTFGSRHGTRLWPLRSHTLRWDTLPVITPIVGTGARRGSTAVPRTAD